MSKASPIQFLNQAILGAYPAFELPRPYNCAIAFLSVVLGGWIGIHAISPTLLIAALSTALILGAGNSHNDLCDLITDRINRPNRPLPSGRLPTQTAQLEATGLAAIGFGLAHTLHSPLPILTLSASIGLVLYNAWLKRFPLIGNLLVSLLCALAFLYGGLAVNAPHPSITPAILVTLFQFGREILKDIEDSAGDRFLPGPKTIPLRWGRRKALVLVTVTYILLILSTFFPFLSGHYGLRYLSLVLLLNGMLIYIIISLWKNGRSANLYKLNLLLKIGMLIGLCAIFTDSL